MCGSSTTFPFLSKLAYAVVPILSWPSASRWTIPKGNEAHRAASTNATADWSAGSRPILSCAASRLTIEGNGRGNVAGVGLDGAHLAVMTLPGNPKANVDQESPCRDERLRFLSACLHCSTTSGSWPVLWPLPLRLEETRHEAGLLLPVVGWIALSVRRERGCPLLAPPIARISEASEAEQHHRPCGRFGNCRCPQRVGSKPPEISARAGKWRARCGSSGSRIQRFYRNGRYRRAAI